MRGKILIAALGCAALSAALYAEPGAVTGTAAYRERIAMPPGAKLVVELLDVSKADVKSVLIAKTEMTGIGQVPVPFTISYDASKIDARMRYQIAARIDVGGQTMFRTTQAYPVLNGEGGAGLALLLQRTGGRNPLAGGAWTLVSMGGKPSLAGVTATLSFSADGRVTGKGGCNNYFSRAEFDGPKLTLAPAGSTMMACTGAKMEQESAYLKALGTVKAWRREGAKLVLESAEAGDLVFAPLKK
jgi:putative lipoprotein